MRITYNIISEKRMYSTAIKMMLDEFKKSNKIFDTLSELKKDINGSKATIFIIGPNSNQDPYSICQELSRLYPLTAVLLFLNKEDIDYKEAMFAGVVDVLDIESDESEIAKSLNKAESLVKMKLEMVFGTQQEGKEAKVVTVCSTKGGVGKTTISVNTAVALSKHNLKVAIIDLDLQFGDVTLMLDRQPTRTIYDWVKQSYEHGDKSYEGFVTKHKLGIDIMAAPSLPEFAELIKGEHVSYLIEKMKKRYDFIIMDTPPSFVETSLTGLELSDTILLIVSLDLPALKNGKMAIETLKLLGMIDKIHVILNRDADTDGLSRSSVEGILGLKISGKIPSDYHTVIDSINKGESFVTMAPRTPVAKAVMKISEKLIGGFSEDKQQTKKKEEKKRGLFFFKSKSKER